MATNKLHGVTGKPPVRKLIDSTINLLSHAMKKYDLICFQNVVSIDKKILCALQKSIYIIGRQLPDN